jgi:hypothetical protein
VREWLVKLRESGIKLFLLTNSGDEFAELLMAHAFGADWRSLFDLVLLKGRKPYYFLMDAPYNGAHCFVPLPTFRRTHS